VLCASPAYLLVHGEPQTPADLERHRLLATVDQLPWRLSGRVKAVTVDRPSHVRTNSSDLIRELALGGVGVALRSLWDVRGALAAGELVRVLPDYEGSARVAIHAVFPTVTPLAAAVALVEHLIGCWRGGAALEGME
jgi:DNA-binding transcriptional LysR family regulator